MESDLPAVTLAITDPESVVSEHDYPLLRSHEGRGYDVALVRYVFGMPHAQ